MSAKAVFVAGSDTATVRIAAVKVSIPYNESILEHMSPADSDSVIESRSKAPKGVSFTSLAFVDPVAGESGKVRRSVGG
jgi:hypothetical protein